MCYSKQWGKDENALFISSAESLHIGHDDQHNNVGGFGVYGYKKATPDMEEQMMAGLSSISTYYYDDPVITAFIVEEIAPYYAGDRSLDDVVRILNDRTGKYVKEM